MFEKLCCKLSGHVWLEEKGKVISSYLCATCKRTTTWPELNLYPTWGKSKVVHGAKKKDIK